MNRIYLFIAECFLSVEICLCHIVRFLHDKVRKNIEK